MSNVFLENHTQSVVEKVFPDLSLKDQNLINIWINNVKFYTICSTVCQIESRQKNEDLQKEKSF